MSLWCEVSVERIGLLYKSVNISETIVCTNQRKTSLKT